MSDVIRKLPKQPLTCVLVEFQYSQVQKIEDYLPDFQESIRREYPVAATLNKQQVLVSGPSFHVQMDLRWIFSSRNQRSAIIVSSDRLIFYTTMYDRFPEFQTNSISLLSKLHDVVDLDLLQHIGLRYNDYIPFENYLNANTIVGGHFLPSEPLTSLGKDINSHKTETSILTAEGTLQIRSLLGKHGMVVMPDLATAFPLKFDIEPDPNKMAIILDYDHIWRAQEPGVDFSPDTARYHLESLHHIAREAFWKSTTPKARNELWT